MIEDHVLSTYFMNPLVPIWWPQYSVISSKTPRENKNREDRCTANSGNS